MKTKHNLLKFNLYNLELDDNSKLIIEKTKLYLDIKIQNFNNSETAKIIIDFKQCEIINSVILHCLAVINKKHKIILINLNTNIKKLLELMKFNEIMEF